MSADLDASQFEILFCQAESPPIRPSFHPFEHDLIILDAAGVLRIAETKKATAQLMKSILSDSNESLFTPCKGGDDSPVSLAIIRFEEDGSSHEPDNDWPHLWPVFDCCCDKNSIPDFVSRFREPDPYYNSSLSRNTRVEGAKAIECIKISYSLNFLSKHVWIAHHFHRSGSETREMIRMMTCSLPREKIERVIRKAAMFVKSSSLAFDGPYSGTSVGVAGKIPNLHPKVILCGMLECLEEECRTNTESYGNEIEKIERAINELRDPIMRRHEVDAGTATHGELGINSWKLSGIVTELIYIRQKLQFILSSIDPLDQTRGFPGSNEACSERTSGNAVGEVLGSRPEQLVSRGRWAEQLQGVHVKLSELRIKCQRNMMNIENLQKLVKANRGALSILQVEVENERAREEVENERARAQKENERARQAQDQRLKAAIYQTSILESQGKMLRQQELIAFRTKRDNAVMKVIAVLTALFLPGTFIATVFSVPVFDWQQENPIGPHFRTYWFFTAPITIILVFGFSIWFLKMRRDDLREERLAEKGEASKSV